VPFGLIETGASTEPKLVADDLDAQTARREAAVVRVEIEAVVTLGVRGRGLAEQLDRHAGEGAEGTARDQAGSGFRFGRTRRLRLAEHLPADRHGVDVRGRPPAARGAAASAARRNRRSRRRGRGRKAGDTAQRGVRRGGRA
jgi:hypothetical protein